MSIMQFVFVKVSLSMGCVGLVSLFLMTCRLRWRFASVILRGGYEEGDGSVIVAV